MSATGRGAGSAGAGAAASQLLAPALSIPFAIYGVSVVALESLGVDVSTPCPMRDLTGVPCPFCGVTRSALAVAGGHAPATGAGAMAVVVMIAVMTVSSAWRWSRSRAVPSLATSRRYLAALVVMLGVNWLVQIRPWL
ncbi:MAG: DUF2752 domain-containing protein [Ilumatobacteraceae bacterium]